VPIEFTADMFQAVEEEWGLVTRLDAPSTEEEDFYLMLQRADEFDAQDVALGMDKYYIEFCGQGLSWYGHVERFDLRRTEIRVLMDAFAREEKEMDGVVIVRFDLDDQKFRHLRQCVEHTFEGFPVLHIDQHATAV
jgi:hypothetical protein